MNEQSSPFELPKPLNEPPGPNAPFVLRDHMTWREFAEFAQRLNPDLARENPEESYVRASAYLEGAAEFMERQAYRQEQLPLELAKVEEQMRTSADYFRLNDPEDVKRLLAYLAEHGEEFKTLEGFLKAYDKEKLPSSVLSTTYLLRRSPETGQQQQMSKTELSKELIISKIFLDKFIEIRKERERQTDAERKREQKDPPSAS